MKRIPTLDAVFSRLEAYLTSFYGALSAGRLRGAVEGLDVVQ